VRKRLLLIAAIVLLSIPLVLLLRDFAREVLLVQAYRIIWTVRILFDTLPQVPLWFFFLLIVAAIAARSVVKRHEPEPPPSENVAEREGQTPVLARWLDRAAKGEYFRWSLERHVADLSLEVMAYRQRIAPEEMRQQLREGSQDAPPEIQAYLQTRNKPAYSLPARPLSRFRNDPASNERSRPPDPALEAVVQFLEDQMEVHRDH